MFHQLKPIRIYKHELGTYEDNKISLNLTFRGNVQHHQRMNG